EYTSSDYIGRDVRFASNGTWLGTSPLESKQNYGVALPSVQMRYAIDPDTNLRVALTRSLARPDYYDTVPYQALDQTTTPPSATFGNADLKPTTSWNVDVLGEHYFKTVGVVSAGFFYKHLTDYIYLFQFNQDVGG